MNVALYMISHERYETLALCLAGLVGFNSGLGPIHLRDDHSTDPRIHALARAYLDRGLLASVETTPAKVGIGRMRRAMVDDFLAGPAEQLVQVEGDMLLGPGAAARLVAAWRDIEAAGENLHLLNTHVHAWCHKVQEFKQVAGYRLGLARSGSEPFWTASRERLAANLALLPAARPDLVLYLKARGCHSIFEPEIQVQHVGAINSLLYPGFSWTMVTYQNHDGTPRQPYGWMPLDFAALKRMGEGYKAVYLDWANALTRRSPLDLPEAPA